MVSENPPLKRRSVIPNTAGMLDVFRVMNDMVEEDLIRGYVVGGGAAVSLYSVPYTTEDIDFFCYYKMTSGFILLEPIYTYLLERGAEIQETNQGKKITLGMWPIDFTPASTPLEEEAMKNAVTFVEEGVPFNMFTPEYLVAISIRVGRERDKQKSLALLEEKRVDVAKLESILEAHALLEKWHAFKDMKGI